ncbi:MAG: NADH-quinone oxidoreductase subunit C [Myxococcota bacterium]
MSDEVTVTEAAYQGPAADLGLAFVAADFALTGFHWRVAAQPAELPGLAERFRRARYSLEMQTAEDRRPDLGVLRLVTTFARFAVVGDRAGVDRHMVVVDLEPGATAPSLCGHYPAANWMEREIFDMFGVHFTGHPDLKRILLPDDSDFHALLKDFGRMDGTGTEHGASAEAAHGD